MQTTLKQTAQYLPKLFKAGIVPFLHSSPAIGKSSLAKQIAKQYSLKVIDLRLTECDSSDLNGLPYFENGKASFLPFNTFPLTDTPIPKGYKGWLLLLDEFNSAPLGVQASAYKLVLDRQVGQHKLHDSCFIIACGNLETDNAIVNTMSSALISRFAHFHIALNHDDWIDWATQNGIDYRIVSYLGFKPTDLYTFTPDVTESYASPRTWEMLSKVIKDEPIDFLKPLIASLVGDAVASQFISFVKLYKDLPTFDEVVDNADKIKVPDDLGTRWALLSMVASKTDKQSATKLQSFFERFPKDLQIVALRQIKANDQSLLFKEMKQWTDKVMTWIM